MSVFVCVCVCVSVRVCVYLCMSLCLHDNGSLLTTSTISVFLVTVIAAYRNNAVTCMYFPVRERF